MSESRSQVTREHLRVQIQTLHKQKLKTNKISEKLGCHRRTVWKWTNRNFVIDKNRPGQPRKVSPTTKRMIKNRLHQKTGSSLRNCAKELNHSPRFKKKSKKIDFTTVHKYVKSTTWGHKAYKLTKEPIMSQKNIDDRLKFGAILQKVATWVKKSKRKT